MLEHQGIVLIDKPKDKTSFYLVSLLRKLTKVRKIGHTGTLDPLATGVMVLLVGKEYTKRAQEFSSYDKEYVATFLLGSATDTLDSEGKCLAASSYVPKQEEIQEALIHFQGEIFQTPPMFSAKKIGGQKLYDLARKGIEIERKPIKVKLTTTLLHYDYPFLKLHITCSSGTYIRSLGDDLGRKIGSYAHLHVLVRTRVGPFHLSACKSVEDLEQFYQENPENRQILKLERGLL